MLRIVNFALIALLIPLLFTACSNKVTKQNSITFVTNIVNDDRYDFDEYIDGFNKLYPDVHVMIEHIYDYESILQTRMATNEFGDVLVVPMRMNTIEYPNFFEYLGSYDHLSKTYRYLEANQVDGSMYSIPTAYYISGGIFYDQSIFTEAGIDDLPDTPSELLDSLYQINSNTSYTPFAVIPSNKYLQSEWNSVIDSMEGDYNYTYTLLEEEDPFQKDSSHYKIYNLFYQIIANQLAEDNFAFADLGNASELFATGQVGAAMLPSYYMPSLIAIAKNPDDIVYKPFIDPLGNEHLILRTSYQLAINKNSQNKEMALKWLNYLLHDTDYLQISQCQDIIIKNGEDRAENPFPYKVLYPAKIDYTTLEKFTVKNWETELGLKSYTTYQEIIDSALSPQETFQTFIEDRNNRW